MPGSDPTDTETLQDREGATSPPGSGTGYTAGMRSGSFQSGTQAGTVNAGTPTSGTAGKGTTRRSSAIS